MSDRRAIPDLPPGPLNRAVQVLDFELEGAARERLIRAMAEDPDWWTRASERGVEIWAKSRMRLHGVRSPLVVDHWWAALEMALGHRPVPKHFKK